MEKKELDEIKEWMRQHAKRCPGCKDSNFTTGFSKTFDNIVHRCYSCGREFTDESALPPLKKI